MLGSNFASSPNSFYHMKRFGAGRKPGKKQK